MKVGPQVAEPTKKRSKQSKLPNAASKNTPDEKGKGDKDSSTGEGSVKAVDLSQINFEPEVKTKDGKWVNDFVISGCSQ